MLNENYLHVVSGLRWFVCVVRYLKQLKEH